MINTLLAIISRESSWVMQVKEKKLCCWLLTYSAQVIMARLQSSLLNAHLEKVSSPFCQCGLGKRQQKTYSKEMKRDGPLNQKRHVSWRIWNGHQLLLLFWVEWKDKKWIPLFHWKSNKQQCLMFFLAEQNHLSIKFLSDRV